jgi:hypothetical protein
LGTARATDAGFELPLRWRATGREQLFPRFIGQLTLSEVRTGTRVQLTGSYAVPLGTIGRFGDGVVGHRLVRRSLNALVDLLGTRLETEVARRIASTSSDRDARFATPDKHDRSEFYVG